MSPKSVWLQLQIREHPITGPYVDGLSRLGVQASADITGWLRVGARKRSVAATKVNHCSSRSHTVLTISITRRDLVRLRNMYTSWRDLALPSRIVSFTKPVISEQTVGACSISNGFLVHFVRSAEFTKCGGGEMIENVLFSQLSIVDLAGSERQSVVNHSNTRLQVGLRQIDYSSS
ncbi:unnamed protein product [Protopolystoma xenopodis]|uniref:Kinesin motor domain-containing protein n=1 Tax=Protopolystoma xenopodis TaxID=117903 RepID=A0A448WAQ5_9PLAT|nr:unnamed protein product [Protopolystoma xenopodis]